MPAQAMAHRATARQLVGHEGGHIELCTELHTSRVMPAATDGGHAPLHLAQHPQGLAAQASRAGVAARNDAVAVVALALRCLTAAGNHEAARGFPQRMVLAADSGAGKPVSTVHVQSGSLLLFSQSSEI
jgi:hypothetical protein